MNCPYCNSEMQKGYLQSSRGMMWGPRKKHWSFIPSKEDEFNVFYGGWFGCFADGYFCPTCKKILIDANASDMVEEENIAGE